MTPTEQILQFLLSTMQDTKTFVLEQAPDLARQIVAWQVGENLLALLVGLPLCIVPVVAAWKFRAKMHAQEESYDVESRMFSAALACAITGVVTLCVGWMPYTGARDLIKAITAPKLVIIEKATDMLKGKQP